MDQNATFQIRGEFIALSQLLKAVGVVDLGSHAKEMIQGGEVKLNGELETRRSKKIYPGDVVAWPGGSVKVLCE